jgi:hypothetical protein
MLSCTSLVGLKATWPYSPGALRSLLLKSFS